MGELERQHGVDTAQKQAVYFAARERRRSLAGIPKLHRTHTFVGSSVIAVPTIDTASVFAGLFDSPITLKTAIRTTANNPLGMVFEFGSSTLGIALAMAGQFIVLTAGASGDDSALAVFNNGSNLRADLEMELVAAVRPGDGRARLWANGREIARATSVNGQLASGWSDTGAGSFATIGSGTVPTVVSTVNFAPVRFEVIEPLSVYAKQIPRQFV